jgi:hypothetical protein
MMDGVLDDNMFGKPVARSSLPADSVVLSTVWNYSVKMDGTFKDRTCCDGSRLKTKGIRYVEQYTACISQCGMRLFFAICAIKNFVVLGADAINAYAQSPPPKTPSYVFLDEQYLAWYLWKIDIALDPNMVLPVLHALQGHPDSGSLWEDLIVSIIESMNFKNNCHESCLYSGVFKGHQI